MKAQGLALPAVSEPAPGITQLQTLDFRLWTLPLTPSRAVLLSIADMDIAGQVATGVAGARARVAVWEAPGAVGALDDFVCAPAPLGWHVPTQPGQKLRLLSLSFYQ